MMADKGNDLEASLAGWRKFNGKGYIENWFAYNRPSKLTISDCAWISVDNPFSLKDESSTISLTPEELSVVLEEEKKSWNSLTPKEVTRSIDELGKTWGLRTGKWLIYVQGGAVGDGSIDRVWRLIAKDVVAGNLGNAAKVSPHDPSSPSHVICVYTPDYLDNYDVQRIRNRLKTEHGMLKRIAYKPDLYTHLGIYAKNPWGVKASRYFE